MSEWPREKRGTPLFVLMHAEGPCTGKPAPMSRDAILDYFPDRVELRFPRLWPLTKRRRKRA